MNREYDIFEKLPDGSPVWHVCVQGLENAIAKLKELAKESPHEYFAMHMPTEAVVGRVNAPESAPL